MRVEDLAILVGWYNERGIIDANNTEYKEQAQQVVEAINLQYPEEKDFEQRDKLFKYLLANQLCGKHLVDVFEKNEKSVEKMVSSFGDLK